MKILEYVNYELFSFTIYTLNNVYDISLIETLHHYNLYVTELDDKQSKMISVDFR